MRAEEQTMKYTEMDRFRDALKGKPRDRVPVFPMIAGWVASTFSSEPLFETARRAKLLADAQISAKEAVGYDALYAYAEPLYIPEAFGCKVRYTPTGPLVDPLPLSMKDLENPENLPFPDARKTGRLPVILEAVGRLNAYGKGEVPVLGLFEGPFTTTCRIVEAEWILRMIMKKPDRVIALLSKVNGFLLDFARALIESGANVILMPEPTASSSMISPKTFKEMVLPEIRVVTRSLSVPCILHICGDTSLILDSMTQSGAEVLSLDQCMDLAHSRKTAPGATLGGNVDPTNSLLMGDEEKVVKDTLNCLRCAGTSRFVLMSGCGVPPKTPIGNLRAMVQTAKEYGVESEGDRSTSRIA
jgi:MtaA/CmuA family methyltransferase